MQAVTTTEGSTALIEPRDNVKKLRPHDDRSSEPASCGAHGSHRPTDETWTRGFKNG